MSLRRPISIALTIAILTQFAPQNVALADDSPVTKETDKQELPVFGKKAEPSSLVQLRERQISVAELRQSRALLKSDQRRARMEHNAWIGHEPLRPNWNAVPSMRSHYERRSLVYVPVYRYRR